MSATISCVCGKSYRIPPGLEGKSFRCKSCNAKMRVPDESTVSQPASGPVEVMRPSEIDKTLIGGQNTVAGNPAMLKFSLSQYAKCFPIVIYFPIAGLIVCPLGALILSKSVLIGAIIGFINAAYFFSEGLPGKAKKKLHSGNLCPAIVIGTHPYTVAVLTDLCSNRSGPKLAIKIIRQPLEKMAGGAPKKGAKLAASAFYFGQLSNGAWDDFMPLVINCACADTKQIDRAVASIDPEDWPVLEQRLASLKSREPGLYKLWEKP